MSGVLKPWHVSYEAVRQQSKAVALQAGRLPLSGCPKTIGCIDTALSPQVGKGRCFLRESLRSWCTDTIARPDIRNGGCVYASD